MRRIEPFLAPPFQRCVCGNERPVFKDADLVGENVVDAHLCAFVGKLNRRVGR